VGRWVRCVSSLKIDKQADQPTREYRRSLNSFHSACVCVLILGVVIVIAAPNGEGVREVDCVASHP
jgi:hypothetical protein